MISLHYSFRYIAVECSSNFHDTNNFQVLSKIIMVLHATTNSRTSGSHGCRSQREYITPCQLHRVHYLRSYSLTNIPAHSRTTQNTSRLKPTTLVNTTPTTTTSRAPSSYYPVAPIFRQPKICRISSVYSHCSEYIIYTVCNCATKIEILGNNILYFSQAEMGPRT